MTDKTFEEELRIFKNVNATDRKFPMQHQNYTESRNAREVTRNQGIARAKLREFVKKEGVDIEFWKNV